MTVTRKLDLKAKKQQVDEAFAGKLRDLTWEQWKEIGSIVVPAVLIAIGAVWAAFQFVQPAPPKVVTMSTGGASGAYHAFGRAYAETLKKAGVKLGLRTSAGSIENLKRLKDPASDVSVALLQGGIADAKEAKGLLSVGRVFLEPLWVFYRAPGTLERLSDLRNQRIAIGPPGSGTRQLAEALLARNEVTEHTATLLPMGGKAAIDALRAGQADAVFLVLAPAAPLIQELMRDTTVKLMSLDQAEAYTRLFPYLSRIVLPKGTFDLVRNIPARDVELVAPVAALVVREDIHPAVVGLLVEAVQDVHAPGGLFHRIGAFPRPLDPEFEMSEDATRYYKSGPSFLKRFLPFWLAIFIERMIVLAVPIATVLIPLAKGGPALYKWRLQKRLRYWYAQLKLLEARINADPEQVELAEEQADLERIDAAVKALSVPVWHSTEYYDLRAAVDMVRSRLEPRRAPAALAAVS